MLTPVPPRQAQHHTAGQTSGSTWLLLLFHLKLVHLLTLLTPTPSNRDVRRGGRKGPP